MSSAEIVCAARLVTLPLLAGRTPTPARDSIEQAAVQLLAAAAREGGLGFRTATVQLQALSLLGAVSAVSDAPGMLKRIDPSAEDIGTWRTLARVLLAGPALQSLLRLPAPSVRLTETVTLATVRIARKQGNTDLAGQLLAGLPMSAARVYEAAKIQASSSIGDAAATLGQALAAGLADPPLAARMYVRLARWAQQQNAIVSPAIHASLPAGPPGWGDGTMLAGQLLLSATSVAPNASKPRRCYADWCYREGRRAAAARDDDSAQIALALAAWQPPTGTDIRVAVDAIRGLFSDAASAGEGHEATALASELRRLLPGAGDDIIQTLLSVLAQVDDRSDQLYRLAVTAYFAYLEAEAGSADDTAAYEQLTATLRLLRLLASRGPSLQAVFAAGLEQTHPAVWARIVPQLLSRLQHPSEFVRSQVLSLLCRIGQASPHLLVYPAVVGCEDAAAGALPVLLHSLQTHSGALVASLTGMLHELRRITVLWEECWLDALRARAAEDARRLSRLDNEAARVASNTSLAAAERERLIANKHEAILRPAASALEQLRASTYGQPPSTPQERRFAAQFGPAIDAAIANLKRPATLTPYSAEQNYAPLRQIIEDLRSVCGRQVSQGLSLTELSPVLAAVAGSGLPVPGRTGPVPITIASFSSKIMVFNTKTRPKKITLLGSDGQPYTYLFKGMEDLHLDERVMQFLDVINSILARTASKGNLGPGAPLTLRTYHVVPLGGRSGLLEWVGAATPLFALYKRWQQRESEMARLLAAAAAETHAAPRPEAMPRAQPLRPSEQFYHKLTPLLKQRGLTVAANRADWPADVMLEVLHELTRATPADLLTRLAS